MGKHPVMKWAAAALVLGFVLGYVTGSVGFEALTSDPAGAFQAAFGMGD